MSARALNWAWEQETKTTNQKLVLAALADRADEDGYCFPSNKWIAHKCSPMPVDTARRVVWELSEMGLVSKEQRRRRDDGTMGTWLLRLSLPSAQQCAVDQRAAVNAPARSSARTEPSIEPKYLPTTDVVGANGKKTKEPDPLWDVFDAEIGEVETKSERGRRNRAVKELRDCGISPTELAKRIKAYRSEWPDITLTETAIVANWTLLSRTNGHTTLRGKEGLIPIDIQAETKRIMEGR